MFLLFTGNGTKGEVYEEILFNIIKKSEDLGLRVACITSDMGSPNLALWRKWGVTAGRYTKTNSSIPHPFDKTRNIQVMADVPHVFKNLKNMLVTNKIVTISDRTKEKFDLPTNRVEANHILELSQYQETLAFQLAPKLTEEDFFADHFKKMKVKTSTNIVSHGVASGLKFVAKELGRPEYLTTSWFIDFVNTWFHYMSSRHPTAALSKFSEESYNKAITSLNDALDVFASISVGESGQWKPAQTGALVSTTAILALQDNFLNNEDYKFLLTGRFTQDMVENLFGGIRVKHPVPNAVQFKCSLRLITVSQFLNDSSKGSYDIDDRMYLCSFVDTLAKMPPKKYEEPHIIAPQNIPELHYNNSELNSLYSIIGYIVSSIKKTSKTCTVCINSLGSRNYNESMKDMARLTKLKAYKSNTLFFCNSHTFSFVCEMERIFKANFHNLKNSHANVKSSLINAIQNQLMNIDFPNCHNIKTKLISRFVMFRLKIASKNNLSKKKIYASKTMRP